MTAGGKAQSLRDPALAVQDLLSALRERCWLGTGRPDDTCLSHFIPPLLSGLCWTGSADRVALAMPHKPKRVGLVDFLNTLANLGWPSSPMRQRLDCLDHRFLPVILVPDCPVGQQNGPLLIVGSTGTEGDQQRICYKVEDVGLTQFEPPRNLFGTVYIFNRPDRLTSNTSPAAQRIAGGWFRSTIERFRASLTQIFLVGLLINAMSVATPVFIMVIYDVIIGSLSTNGLVYLVLGVMLAIGAESMLRFLRLRSIAWLGTRADYLVSVSIFGRLLNLPPMYTEKSSVSAELSRIKTFESVREFFTGPTLLVLLELPFVVVLLLCIAYLAGPVATIPIAMMGCYVALLLYMRPKLRNAIWLAAKANSEKEKMLVETFSKVEGMRFNSISDAWSEHFREVSGRAAYGNFRASFLASIIETLAHGLSVLAGVATITAGVFLIWDGQMTVGALIASLILIWRVLAPLQTLCTMLPRIEQLVSSIDQVDRLMAIEPEPDKSTMATSRKAFRGHIRFMNVGLRYSKNLDPVFAGLSIEIQPGELVAITGNNGAGKSTALKLVNRLCVPQAGSIRIDGADIRQLDPVELRRSITYVSEHPVLFHGTIAENLRLADPICSDAALKSALIQADAWNEVSMLPKQLNTFVGEGKNLGLSSGFAHRINLARAYLQDSSIMLIDEIPFSLLNSTTGEVYKDFLKKNKGKRTILIVTYRDDYIELADKVIFLSPDSRPVIGTSDKNSGLGMAA